jgi:polysaccharide deacetylase family protein (PEP-CTERM system associated)
MLDAAKVKATFFTLGWIAERYPQTIKRITENGHELASHGYGHLRASDQTPEEFRKDVSRAKALLEDLSGHPVVGYRAPSFSIGERNLWALDTLRNCGYRYSSSIYPVRHDHYGMPDAPRFAFAPIKHDQGFIELPATTLRVLGRNLPAAGGGFFRLLPYACSRWLLRQVNHADRQPAIFYFHPWEIDPEQPRPKGLDAKTRFRHYVNLRHTEARLRRLMADFQWGRVDQIFLRNEEV